MNVTVVTVTYGKRAHLLTQVLDAARAQGVTKAIVIDNGSTDPVPDILAERYGDWATIHSLGQNLGSAAAFRTGFEVTLTLQAQYILVLDDDNVLQEGCLDALMSAYREKAQLGGKDIAVCCYRAKFYHGSLRALLAGKPRRIRSSFHGFHFAAIPSRVWKRLFRHKQDKIETSNVVLSLDYCTYGGLLVHRSTLEKIGSPDQDFFLYEDYEYTQRITKSGGRIFLVCDAKILDIDETWNETKGTIISFFGYLHTEQPALAYYSFRNACYSDFYVFPGNRFVVMLNSLILMGLMLIYALFSRQSAILVNFKVLLQAYVHGVRRKLGNNNEFKIRQAS